MTGRKLTVSKAELAKLAGIALTDDGQRLRAAKKAIGSEKMVAAFQDIKQLLSNKLQEFVNGNYTVKHKGSMVKQDAQQATPTFKK